MLLLQQFAVAQPLADFFKQTFEERLRDDPEFATTVGHHEYDDRWTRPVRYGARATPRSP
jgi:hypothetical protein